MIITPKTSSGHICFRQGYEYFHGDKYVFISGITNPIDCMGRRENANVVCTIEEWNSSESGKLFPVVQPASHLDYIMSEVRKLQKGVIKNRIFVTPDGRSVVCG